MCAWDRFFSLQNLVMFVISTSLPSGDVTMYVFAFLAARFAIASGVCAAAMLDGGPERLTAF